MTREERIIEEIDGSRISSASRVYDSITIDYINGNQEIIHLDEDMDAENIMTHLFKSMRKAENMV